MSKITEFIKLDGLVLKVFNEFFKIIIFIIFCLLQKKSRVSDLERA